MIKSEWVLAGALLSFPLGCGGEGVSIGSTQPGAGGPDGDSTIGLGGTDSTVPAGVTTAQPSTTLLPARTWKLTHEEYRRTVLSFLGVDVATQNFALELDSGVFRNLVEVGFVRVDLAEDYATAAETLTNALTEQQLTALIPCGSINLACADEFIAASVDRAFRRPARPEELVRYRSIFDVASVATDLALPFRSVLRGLLTSPHFLYRTEVGAPEAVSSAQVALTDYEIANLLSYSLLGEPPSPELMAAAAQGGLTNVDTLRLTIGGLLSTASAATQLRKFLSEWLEVYTFPTVDKFDDTYPGFNAVRDFMAAETEDILAQQGGMEGTLLGLLTAPVPSVAAELDAFYGSDATSVGNETRQGILGLGTVLALKAKPNLTSPTVRGLFVRKRLLCQVIQIPPGLVIPPLSDTEARITPRTTRELYEQHALQQPCATCHQLLDQVGFTLESFDGAGRFRSQENTFPIDTSATLTGTDVDRPVANYVELQQALTESDATRQCLATQSFRFYFGQQEPSPTIPAIAGGQVAVAGSGTLRDLVLSLMSTTTTFERARN